MDKIVKEEYYVMRDSCESFELKVIPSEVYSSDIKFVICEGGDQISFSSASEVDEFCDLLQEKKKQAFGKKEY